MRNSISAFVWTFVIFKSVNAIRDLKLPWKPIKIHPLHTAIPLMILGVTFVQTDPKHCTKYGEGLAVLLHPLGFSRKAFELALLK